VAPLRSAGIVVLFQLLVSLTNIQPCMTHTASGSVLRREATTERVLFWRYAVSRDVGVSSLYRSIWVVSEGLSVQFV
jgi:hypothetical protein